MPTMTYAQALNQALREEMRRDERVFIFGEEVAEWGGSFTVSRGLLEEFGPRRVLDTPIAEEVILGLGIGAAMLGLRPVAEIMTVNFILLALDMIINHAAKLRSMSAGQISVPLVVRSPGGGGLQMAAQHSQSFEALFVHVPGLIVLSPATPRDAKGLLKAAIRSDDPVIFLEHEALYPKKGEVPEGEYLLPIGEAGVKREGEDVTLISYSAMVLKALEAADSLSKEGIDVEVIDLRSLRPLDVATLVASVRKTGRAVVVQEAWPMASVGSEVAAQLMREAFDYLDAPVQIVSSADVPMPYSSALEKLAIPTTERIVKAVKSTL